MGHGDAAAFLAAHMVAGIGNFRGAAAAIPMGPGAGLAGGIGAGIGMGCLAAVAGDLCHEAAVSLTANMAQNRAPALYKIAAHMLGMGAGGDGGDVTGAVVKGTRRPGIIAAGCVMDMLRRRHCRDIPQHQRQRQKQGQTLSHFLHNNSSFEGK